MIPTLNIRLIKNKPKTLDSKSNENVKQIIAA